MQLTASQPGCYLGDWEPEGGDVCQIVLVCALMIIFLFYSLYFQWSG